MHCEMSNKKSTLEKVLSAHLGASIQRTIPGFVRRVKPAIVRLTFAAFLLLTPAGQPARGDAVPAPSSESITTKTGENPLATAAGNPYALGVGDRLRINVYGHKDLSGESVVRTDGSLVVPLLGALEVTGRQVTAIEKEIGETLLKMTGQTGFVSVDVVEWRPIFTVGVVDKPGTYPFVPGMTVLHALAAAGGFHRPSESAALFLESSREASRNRRSKEQLSNSLGREARILAEIAGQEKAEAPRLLAELVGTSEAERIIAAENRLMNERLAIYRQQTDAFNEIIKLVEKEIVAMKAQHNRTQRQVQLSNEELLEVDNYAKRGLTNRNRLFEAKRIAIAAEAESRAILASLAQSERALANSRRDRTILDANRKLQLEATLKTTREEVRKYDEEMRASGELLRRISGGKLASNGDIQAIYKIMRLVAGNQVTIDAEETTALRPGDLVRVSLPQTGPSYRRKGLWFSAKSMDRSRQW